MPRHRHPDPFSPSLSPRRLRGPWASPEPSSPGTSPTSAFGYLGASSAVTSMSAISSRRGSGWPRSTLSPTSLRCARRRPISPAQPPALRMPPRPRPASARCSGRTLPLRPSTTLRRSHSRPRRRALTAPRQNSTRPRSNLAILSFPRDFDGVVTAVQAERGQVVQPGQTVVTVARPDIREAVVDLPESIGRDLRPGARFDVALQVDPSVRAAGSVREIAPQADPTTRTRRVRITLDQPAGEFPSRNDDYRNGHDAGCPGYRAAQSSPCWSGTTRRWSGSSTRLPGRCRPGT